MIKAFPVSVHKYLVTLLGVMCLSDREETRTRIGNIINEINEIIPSVLPSIISYEINSLAPAKKRTIITTLSLKTTPTSINFPKTNFILNT